MRADQSAVRAGLRRGQRLAGTDIESSNNNHENVKIVG